MKRIIYTAVCAAMLVSCDCKFDMTTIVDKDGSITRVISCQADSAFMCGTIAEDKCPIAVTPDWEPSWLMDGAKHQWPLTPEEYDSLCRGRRRVVDLTRRFESVEEMNRQFQFDALLIPVKPVAELRKKFKLFHTDYTYTETFPQYGNPKVPVTDYMSMDEAILFFQGAHDVNLTRSGSVMFDCLSNLFEQAEKWLFANKLAEAFSYLVQNYDSIAGAPMSKQEFLAQEDAFIKSPVPDLASADLDYQMLRKVLKDFFETDAYSDFIAANSQNMGDYYYPGCSKTLLTQGLPFFMNLTFDYVVCMPGTVISAPGAIVGGNAAVFLMNFGMIYPADYTITVQSRTQNIWAYVLLFILLTAAFIGIPLAKRKKLEEKSI